MALHEKKCIPCNGGVPKLLPDDARAFATEVPSWRLEDDRLHRELIFGDFKEALDFVVAMADVAEAEGHHPDFCVHWNRVAITIWTHAIGGLSESDFILAAKLDRIAPAP